MFDAPPFRTPVLNPPAPVTNTDPATEALLEAVRRAARGGAGRTVLLLHLNAITSPRPHHARVASAILSGVAQRLGGEVMRLRGGELALLCRHDVPAIPGGPDDAGPEGLAATLAQLFGAAAPAEAALSTVWHLPADAAMLQQWLGQAATTMPPAPAASPDPLDLVGALLDFDTMPELMRRQTAVQLRAPGGQGLTPCFREITFSIEALERRIAAIGQATVDPFVFRHLSARLDDRMLTSLARQLEQGGPVVALAPGDTGIRTHVNLAVSGILSEPFERLAAACRAHRMKLGVELSYVEAAAMPDAFATARDRLRAAGVALILDGVSAAALQITRPAALDAELIKLEWTPALPRLAGLARGRLVEALRAIGPERVVLHRAETEAALAWGVAHGINLFQGRHVDAMLGAGRITACAHAGGCALRQCIDRAAALDAQGRSGCHSTGLLDRPSSAIRASAVRAPAIRAPAAT